VSTAASAGSGKTKAERKRAAVLRDSGSKRKRLTVKEAKTNKVRRVRGVDILSRNSPRAVFLETHWKKMSNDEKKRLEKLSKEDREEARKDHFRAEAKRVNALWMKSKEKKDADKKREAAKAAKARK
jgi:hypothetical protein